MGQRLVIEIYNGDKRLANAYYHWGGYTCGASEVANCAIEYYMNYLNEKTFFEDKEKDMIYKAVRMLAETGAGLQSEEIEPFNKMFPNLDKDMKINESESRNHGIICITEEEMDNSYSWNEGSITIHLDTETVDFDCIWEETYAEWFDESIWGRFKNYTENDNFSKKELKENRLFSLKKLREFKSKKLIAPDTFVTFKEEINSNESYYDKENNQDKRIAFLDNGLYFDNIPMEDFNKLVEFFEKMYNDHIYDFVFKNDLNTVYCMIE